MSSIRNMLRELMIEYERKKYSSNIVLIGNFSPTMFQPYWFKRFGIISEEEYSSLDKDNLIIVGPVSRFQTEKFIFNIEEQRLVLIAKQEPFELLMDLFERLQENMDPVIVKSFGINFSYHVDLITVGNMKKIGDVIAPKKYWQKFFDNNQEETLDGLNRIGMTKKTDFGYASITMESSALIKYGLFFNFNYHFVNDGQGDFDMIEVKDLLKEKFFNLADYSKEISNQLIKDALGA